MTEPVSAPAPVVRRHSVPTNGLDHVHRYFRGVGEIPESILNGFFDALVAYLHGRLH